MTGFYMAATVFMFQTLVMSIVIFIPVFVIFLHQNIAIDLKEKLEKNDRKKLFHIAMIDSFAIALLINGYHWGNLPGVAVIFAGMCALMAIKIMVPHLKQHGFFRRKKINFTR